jgi:hypothetical protein
MEITPCAPILVATYLPPTEHLIVLVRIRLSRWLGYMVSSSGKVIASQLIGELLIDSWIVQTTKEATPYI